MPPIIKTIFVHKVLLCLLLSAGIILSWNINKPFWGHHDWNGVYWGQVARNFAVHGPFFSSFGMILNSGSPVPSEFNYNFHFSPLFTLIWAGFFKIFGIHEWVSRFMASLFSLGTIAIFYLIIKKYFGQFTAIVSSLFWIATPMFIYFGKMPVHEIPLMFFVLLAIYLYLNKKGKWLLPVVIIAELVTWPGYFLVLAITLHWLAYDRGKTWHKNDILTLWLVSPFVFLSLLIHNRLVTGDFFGGGLREVFFLRVGGVAMISYVTTMLRWAITYYFLLIPMAAIGLLTVIWRKEKRIDILLLFLTYAVIYPIVFRDSSSRHDYLLIYFWPFLSLSAAIAINIFKNKVIRYFTVLAILIIMLWARKDFVTALIDSSLYRESVKTGEFIGKNSVLTDKILVISRDESVPFDGWFAGYYANRPVTFSNNLTEDAAGYKVFYYLPGGIIKTGEEINNNGIK